VLEVGCGDGRVFEHYPQTVEHVLAIEPDPIAREVAAERAVAAEVDVEVREGVAESLPAADRTFDAAVVSGVLCTVPDPVAALRELRRVLVPGGELRVFEHVRSGNAALRSLQRAGDRLFWTRALGGCRTTRDTKAALEAAGFDTTALEDGFHATSPVTITCAPYIFGAARAR
jgi:ubiquinone/menaquinone biosynthesis C-methylase UbiE